MRILVLMVGVLMVACGGPPPERALFGHTAQIDTVELEGVRRFSKDRLLRHLHLGTSSWMPFSAVHWFDEALLPVDAERIEALYRAYGYGSARVMGIEVTPKIDDPTVVDLRVRVEEGEVTTVRALSFVWAKDTSLAVYARRVVEDGASLSEGGPFEVERLNDSIGALRLALRGWGYPMARVSADVSVNYGAQAATVVFKVSPGPFARVRRVRIEGLREVPEDRVQVEVSWAAGSISSPALTQQIEHTVRGLDVFSWVTSVPPEAVDDGLVDVVLRVSEAEPQRLKLGLEMGFEATRWEERVVGRYTHTNLDGRLTRLDLGLMVGHAQLPNPSDPEVSGVVAEVRPTFTRKGLLEDHLRWTLEPALKLDVVEGYKYYSPTGRFGVGRWFAGFMRTDLSYNLSYVDFFDISPTLKAGDSLLGRDFRDPYILSSVNLQLDLFRVDNLHDPHNGTVFEARYALAGGPFLGDFDHHHFTGTLRGYARPWSWLQIAARAIGGVIAPYGDKPGVPVVRKFYLGGANSVRGWGSRRISPRLVECDDLNPNDCDSVPIGGLSMAQGNLELRLMLGKWALVAFADVGDVQADDWTWNVDEWNYSAGPGVRFDSPVGMFRLDAGFRLNDTGVFPDEPGMAIYFGVGETF